MVKRTLYSALVLVSSAVYLPAHAQSYSDCVVREVTDGDSTRSAADIRRLCEKQTALGSTVDAPAARPDDAVSAAKLRRRAEAAVEGRPYALTAHQPTFVMATTNTRFNAADSIYAQVDDDFADLKKEEIKFQVSVKVPVWQQPFGAAATDVYLAYTQTSWWQLFSDKGITSAPFRETNYEPELFIRHRPDLALPFGGQVSQLDVSFNHQSNGRSEFLSRSWNRLMGRAELDYGDLTLLGRLWWRLPEDEEDDDNPREYRYLGYGDIRAIWAPNKHTFSAMWRPGTEGSGVELTWSHPVSNTLRIYAQWWHGYGESLIDYDQRVNRFGIGISINDFMMRSP